MPVADQEVGVRLAFVDVDTGSITSSSVLSDPIGYLAVSPDGTRLAGSSCCSGDHITVTSPEGGDPHALASASGRNQYGAAWSPDGAQLVVQDRSSVGGTGSLLITELENGATTTVVEYEDEERSWWWMAPAFSADGERILFHLARDAGPTSVFDVWSVPVTGGRPELIAEDAAFPVALADGSIAVVSGMRALFDEAESTISIVEPGGGMRELISVEGEVWQPRASPDGSRLAFVEDDPEGIGRRIRIVDIASGETSIVAEGDQVDWLDDDTLVVATGRG
jgi:Tol biopolymer transport system component